MFTLFHHPFCPHSRFIRLILGEYGFDLRLIEERAWERREDFLALNPACTTPVLFAEGMPAIPGPGIIAEYIDEAYGAEMGDKRLLPATMGERIEVRRLLAWFNDKFFEEASNPLVTERIYKRFMREVYNGSARCRHEARVLWSLAPCGICSWSRSSRWVCSGAPDASSSVRTSEVTSRSAR